jgi:hypothetical protein
MTGPHSAVPADRGHQPGYNYEDDWIAATAFDWIEEPLGAIADAFFGFITHHRDPVAHGQRTNLNMRSPTASGSDRPANRWTPTP